MESKITWNGQMRFEGQTESGFQIPMDAGVESGGTGYGPRPMELLVVSLAGCTGMDVISILRKKQQQVSGFEIKVHAVRSGTAPTLFTNIVLEFIVTGQKIEPAALDRAIQLSAEKYCPIQAMLSPGVTIEHRATILEGV